MENLTIDRIEESFAVCENEKKQFFNVPLHLIVDNVKEGDIIYFLNGFYYIDRLKTDKTRQSNVELQNKLWK